MNERIKELAEQADIHGDSYLLYQHRLEKFAELIIREYSYDVMNLTSMPDHVEMAARHWGVEL